MKVGRPWLAIKISTWALAVLICGVVVFLGLSALMTHLAGTSYSAIPQYFYGMAHSTREVAGLVVRDKTGARYEYEVKLDFENKTGSEGTVDFTFFWDVVEGFDERAVAFDKPGVAYEVGPGEEGWRRLKVRCEGFDADGGLTAMLRYPADALVLRNAVPGYYKWDLDEHTAEDIPELDSTMASHENLYACANWIRQNIAYVNHEKEPQTAEETFRTGAGDCDDIAILFCYMVKRLFPEMAPRIVEGWTVDGRYHANVVVRTDEGWLMLDPSISSSRFGVFDFKPFVPSGRVSVPFNVTAEGRDADGEDVVGIAFESGTVREM
jgi:hypothetical protein